MLPERASERSACRQCAPLALVAPFPPFLSVSLSPEGGRKNKPIKYQIVVVNRSLSRMKKLACLAAKRERRVRDVIFSPLFRVIFGKSGLLAVSASSV